MTTAHDNRFRLPVKLALVGAGIGLVVGILFGIIQLASVSKDVADDMRRSIQRSLDAVVPAAQNALWRLNRPVAEEIVDGLINEPNIEQVVLSDVTGEIDIVARTLPEGVGPERSYPITRFFLPGEIISETRELSVEYRDAPQRVGALSVSASQARLVEEIQANLTSISVTVLMLTAAFGIATLIGGYLIAARPLSRLGKAVLRLQREEPDAVRVVEFVGRDLAGRRDEIGDVSRAIVRSFSAMRESEARFRDLIEGSVQGCVISQDGVVVFANRAAATIFAYPDAAAMIGTPLRETFPAEDGMNAVLNPVGDEIVELEQQNRLCRDGKPLIVSLIARPIDWEGRRAWQETLVDVTEKVRIEAELDRLATRDPLTGLANRVLLNEHIDMLIRTHPGDRHAVFYVDLDGFKFINDSHGHDFGDRVLQEIAGRLKTVAPNALFLARLGGDDFGAALREVADDAQIVDTYFKIMEAIRVPLMIGSVRLDMEAKVGVAVAKHDGADAATLLRNAETAMYAAKAERARELRFFDSDLSHTVQERLAIEGAMRDSLTRIGDFFLVYQPKIDALTRRPVGVEALVRWARDGEEQVRPNTFIPIAEQTGLIIPLGRRVLHMAALQARAWTREHGLDIPVAVNISAVQLKSGLLPNDFSAVLHDAGIPSHYLQLEVTETGMVDDLDGAVQQLTEMRGLGAKIALDDFGTGYSSLSYLNRMPIDYLKLDQSFTRCLDTADGRAIASVVSSLGRNLGLTLIAEGVETQQDVTTLNELRYNQFQGYFFSRPLLPDDIVGWWRNAA
ncbi:MAG: EAL domain-containing protein [Alphaproteobacteria bacterium]|nr:EAL domain-containing protein [Alphaproteobacteria bacterium]